MTRKELYDVLDEAVGNTPRVDLAEAAWAQGVGMRRRRRAAFAGGGTVLAAAAVVGALVISGGLAPDEDVAPAVPTSTPGPSQVEPGPVDLGSAVTFMFHREGTNPTIETSSMQALPEVPVPSQEDVVDTSWELVTMGNAAEASQFLDITLADADTVGADVSTALDFHGVDGKTVLMMDTGCYGPTFQEDLGLAPDGRFAGQAALISGVGCGPSVPDSSGFWGPALEGGGWLHQPHEDVLLLSVIVPEDVAPAPETTNSTGDDEPATPELANAHTFAFQPPGSDVAFDAGTVPPLAEQQIPALEDLTDSSWELIPVDLPWYLKGPNESSGINIVSASDYEPRVPTTLDFLEEAGMGTLLGVSLADCGAVTLAEEGLTLSEEGRFAAQEVSSTAGDCDQEVPETFWVDMLAQGGWLHQPSDDVLLLSIVAPDGLLPDAPPVPDAPDPTQGVEALDIGDGLPEGWSKIVLGADREDMTTRTCLLPGDETELLFLHSWCGSGALVVGGVDPEAAAGAGGWWDPSLPAEDGPAEECYAARRHYGDPENAANFSTDPETGSTTIDGHPVEWSRWSATCAGGQEFVAEAWRVIDLGIEVRSMDGSLEVEPLVRALLEDGRTTTMGQVDVEVAELTDDILTGELQVWQGVHRGTGEQVTFTITDDTRCLITTAGGVVGADLELGSCGNLTTDLEEYPIARVTVTPDGEVLTVHVPATF